MNKPTVYAVVTATIEVRVQPSSCEEKLIDLYRVAEREAAEMLQVGLPQGMRVVGEPKFSHAVVKEHRL